MVKFHTLVLRVFLAAGLCGPSLAWSKTEAGDANPAPTYADSGPAMLDRYNQNCKSNPPQYTPEQCQAIFNKAIGMTPNDSDDCSTAVKTYVDAKKDFASSCGAAGAPVTKDNGSVECSVAVNKCLVCGSSNTTSNTSNVKCPNKSGGHAEDGDGYGGDRLAQGKRLAEYCSAKLASVDQDKLQKEYDKTEKEVNDAQKELPTILKKATDAKKSASKDIQAIRDEANKNESDYAKKVNEARKARSGRQREIFDQIQQMNDKINQAVAALDGVASKRMENQLAFVQKKNQIDLNCDIQATTQVEQEQTLVYGLLKNQSYNRGKVQNLYNRVGISDRQAWQRKAALYKNWCMISNRTQMSNQEANMAMNLGKVSADKQEATIRRQIATYQQQMETLSSLKACNAAQGQLQSNGQVPAETQMCQAARESQDELSTLAAEYQANKTNLNAKYNDAVTNASADMQSAQQEYAQKQDEIRQAKDHFENLKQYMDLVDKAGAQGDTKAFTNMTESYQKFKVSAQRLVQCQEKLCGNQHPCAEAKNFLASINESIDPSTTETKLPTADLAPVGVTPPARTPSATRTPDNGDAPVAPAAAPNKPGAANR